MPLDQSTNPDAPEPTVGPSESQRAESAVLLQTELARQNDGCEGNIMAVNPLDLELAQHTLISSKELTSKLSGNQAIIDALVAEEMRPKIRDFLAQSYQAETGRSLSDEQAEKETARRIYRGGVASLFGNLSLNHITGGRAARIDSRQSLKDRITELEATVARASSSPNPLQAQALHNELTGLKALQKEWVIKEKGYRTSALLIKDSSFKKLDERWGFLNIAGSERQDADGTPRSSLDDILHGARFMGAEYDPGLVMTLTELNQDNKMEHLYMSDEAAFHTWARAAYPTQVGLLLKIYHSSELKTYRALAQAVQPDELRNWRASEEGRLLFMMLSSAINDQDTEKQRARRSGLPLPPSDLTLMSGGDTYPDSMPTGIKVVGVMEELQGDESIENIDAEMTKVQTERDHLHAKLDGTVAIAGASAVLGLRQVMESRQQSMEGHKDKMNAYKKHLEIIRENKARKLQEEWIQIESDRALAEFQVNTTKDALTSTPPPAPNMVNALNRELETRQGKLDITEKSQREKEAEMRYFYEEASTTTPPSVYPRRAPYNNFEGVFNSGILRPAHGTTSPTENAILAKISSEEHHLHAAKLSFDITKEEHDKVNAQFGTLDAQLQKLKLQKNTLNISSARVEKIPSRIGIEDFHTLLRAKKIEVQLCAQLGFGSTTDLSAEQRAQCTAEAKGMIAVQKETLRSAEYGKKIETDLTAALDKRHEATSMGPQIKRQLVNLPRNASNAAGAAWRFTMKKNEEKGSRNISAPFRAVGATLGFLGRGVRGANKKLSRFSI